MSNLPPPMTPPDCDCRGHEWMTLLGHRLFNSKWYMLARRDGRGGIAALKLWWVAFLEVPSGSLPDDDEQLSMLADFGADLKTWRKHREIAMHGFVLCSDGRLYHPTVAEVAMEAFDLRLKRLGRRDADRERLKRWRDKRNGHQPPTNPTGNGRETPHETRFDTPPETRSETGRETRLETRAEHVSKRVGQDSTIQDKTVQYIQELKNSGSPLTGAREASGSTEPEAVGPEKAAAVVLEIQAATRMKAYPPRKAVRSPDEQISAVVETRPKAAYLTPEQLAMARRRTA